ncbi:MAG: hypothetical protein M3441_28315 [Chloroflexota bacterium]|nr:hypothetical protein [Chloroflexota bacterium]
MAGTGDFGAGTQLVMYQGMHRMIAQLHPQGGRDPLLDFAVGGEALRLRQALLQLGELGRGQGRGFAGWHINVQQRIKATLRVLREPAANGIAVNAKEGGGLAAAAGLAAGEEIEQMEALPLAMVALLLEADLERIGRLVDGRHRAVHGAPCYDKLDRGCVTRILKYC